MRQERLGFTLVEMLIVLLIIGVLVGITLLSPTVGGPHRTVKAQSVRLQMLFSRLRDKALIENAEFGFSVDSAGTYRWWMLPIEDFDWVLLKDKPFQPYKMPNGYSIKLATDEQEDAVSNTSDEEDEAGPSVVFYTDLGSTPFSLSIIPLSDKTQMAKLMTDGLSNVKISQK